MTVDKRRTDACLVACEGISTQNLEDNEPFLELARRYNVVLRERDALRAKIAAMEQQEPVATIHINSITGNPSVDFIPGHRYLHHNSSLYALPGAKGE